MMNTEAAKIFSRVVLAKDTVKIKLLGDSITHGVGGSGFCQDGEAFISGFARNTSGYCWANSFKARMEERYNCKVVNNACTGTNIEFIIKNFDILVDGDDDMILCTIGTNNRHQSFKNAPKHTKEEHMEAFYENVLKLSKMFKDAKKDVIFMANIPASSKNEEDGEDYWRIFHMNDVSDIYLKASFEADFPFISLYNAFLDYCENEGVTVDSLLSDGLHPNDKGYDVMLSLIERELGLALPVK
jgi:lysophospholipase L1-like esterase